MKTDRYLRVFLAIVLGFGVMHIGSLAVFLYSPQTFYFRPGEYFSDLGYQVRDMPLRWQHQELQDQSRLNFFYYQRSHMTTVTADNAGFRSRRYDADSYPIMVTGDSTIFGSGLSDDETLPWRLAEELHTPVFNAGRTTLSNALAYPPLRETKVVVEGWTERDIKPRLLLERTLRLGTAFQPFAPRNLSYMEAVRNIPPQRYSLPLIAWSIGRRIYSDILTLTTGGERPYLFLRPHVMFPEDLDQTVALLVARSRTVESLGKRYIFLPVPAKQTIYADNVDEYTRNFIPTLVARLHKEGVEAIDLVTPFFEEKDEKLFYPYDSHWNRNGAALGAKVLARAVLRK